MPRGAQVQIMQIIVDEYANSRRPTGFTPMVNARLTKALRAAFTRQLALGHKPDQAQREAASAVARTLPPLPFAKRYHLPKPSRSDDPSYCKPNVLKRFRSCAAIA